MRMNRYYLGSILLLAGLQSCSSVTVMRTSEMKKISEDATVQVTTQMRSELDSLRHSLDSLHSENARLQKRIVAEVATLNTRVGSIGDQLNSRQEEILYRLDLLVDASAKSVKRVVVDKHIDTSSTGSPGLDSMQRAVESEISSDPELDKLYSTARADFHRSEYKLAYDGFKQVYEKVKDGELAENSLYWMGLCLSETQQAEKALTLYQRVLDQFPKGKKSCVVLMKLAELNEIAAKKDDEITQLERLTALPQCRESNEALRAIEMLDQLKGSGVKP